MKFKEVLKSIDIKNPVLMRSLYYFSKACALVSHKMMAEEVTALQFFALEGISKLLMKKHKLSKFKELDKVLIETYKCPYGGWLKDCHDERTIYVHPDNIHLTNWCPPWEPDDMYETFELVRTMFEIYLLGKFTPPPGYVGLEKYLKEAY